MRELFNVKGTTNQNLSGQTTLVADRGYLQVPLILRWLETGGDLLVTVILTWPWVCVFRIWQEAEDWPWQLFTDYFARGVKHVYLKRYTCNFDRRQPKDKVLNAVTCSSGTILFVTRLLSSREEQIHWDKVLVNPWNMKTLPNLLNQQSREYICCLSIHERVWFNYWRWMVGLLLGENETILRDDTDDMDVCPHSMVLAYQGVSPVIQVQLCNVWCLCQAFSLTSSFVENGS